MKHLLIPIDGSERSVKAVAEVEHIFPPERADVTLLTVREDVDSTSKLILDQMVRESMPLLDRAAALIPRYAVTKAVEFGIPEAPSCGTQSSTTATSSSSPSARTPRFRSCWVPSPRTWSNTRTAP